DPAAVAAVAALSKRIGHRSGEGQGLLCALGRRWLRSRAAAPALTRRLELSGVPWTIEQVVGLKIAAAGGGMAAGVLLTWTMAPAAPSIAMLAVVGYRGPDVLLARRARRRQ